ncbi:MAG: efflux RND transporter periplasmic adaptor subunit [Hyphomicrobiaceae bacterium]
MSRTSLWIFLLALIIGTAACGKKEEPTPQEKIVNVTVARVVARDLPVTESAVGGETWVSQAETYDPTRDLARRIYIRLPFPLEIVRRLRVGQEVTLTNFDDNRKTIGVIREIRPALSTMTQTVEVIAEIRKPGAWRPSGSVRGEVTLDVHRHALVVPEQAIVLRPAGAVIYVVENGVAHARTVKTGIDREGIVEILEGVKAGETVAVDGAALLSDGAKVGVRTGAPAPENAGTAS